MKEIEVKIFNINKKELEKKLISLGAKKIFEKELDALLFESKGKKLNKTIRLRKEGKKVFFTTKSHVKSKRTKIREEYEIEVSDFEETKKILESLNFSPKLRLVKIRTSYKLGNTHFEFDKYKGKHNFIPEFLEIESPSEEKIYKYAKLLGFKEKDCKPWSIFDIIEKSKKKRKFFQK